MEKNRTLTSTRQAERQQWASAPSQPRSFHRHCLCPEDRNPLGRFTPGNGLRLRDERLAPVGEMARAWDLAKDPRNFLERTRPRGPYRLEEVSDRWFQRSRSKRGAETGPNPTDRAKSGTKRHLITDQKGIPIAVRLSPANTHDVKEALPTVEAIPSIQEPRGRPRKRPDSLGGDKAYDSEDFRNDLREKNIEPKIEKRRKKNSNLGKNRWVIERTFSWLNRYRRLKIRYERRSDIHEAFLYLGCALICANVSLRWFC